MNNRRPRRTKAEITEQIVKSATKIIEDKGFNNLTVVGISHEAEIEPIVFYNRFNDLPGFINEYVKSCDYWFSDIMTECKFVETNEEQYKAIIKTLFTSLQENKIMQELLRYEVSENNDITQRTAKLREYHTLPLTQKYKNHFKDSPIDIEAVSALIIGGIYYLTLHKDLTPFSGIDINTKEGKEKISHALEFLSDRLFGEK